MSRGPGDDSRDPTDAWISSYEGRPEFKFKSVKPKELLLTYGDGEKVRIVCMSDTHDRLHHYKHPIPDGDIFIHAGDFTMSGKQESVIRFNEFLGQLPHKYKLVIAGNHETTFDPRVRGKRFPSEEINNTTEEMSDLLTNCIYLEDSGVEIMGIEFYGSPWTPEFSCNWGFNAVRGAEIRSKWDKIPKKVDVLITHGPPLGHLDQTQRGEHVGCEDLLNVVTEIKPQFHIFGHIHEDSGIVSNGRTVFINASTCSRRCKPINPPIVFDIEPSSQSTKSKKSSKCTIF